MNNHEQEVIDLLVRAHNVFLALPREHPHEISEWVSKFHDLQRMVLVRPELRLLNEKKAQVQSGNRYDEVSPIHKMMQFQFCSGCHDRGACGHKLDCLKGR